MKGEYSKNITLPLISLFSSFATLTCCALPALLVSLGAGAVLAGLITNFPQLIFLSKYKIIAVILSSILGPLTYFAGSPLGLININNLFLFFILMIAFWAILMILYLNYIKKLNFK